MPSDDMLQAAMTTVLHPVPAPSAATDDHRIARACAAGDAKVFEEIGSEYPGMRSALRNSYLISRR